MMTPGREWSVLLIGAGGLGCAAALALVQVGVTRLGLADGDRLALSNLHRQILYRADEIGTPKVDRAAARLEAIAPTLRVERHEQRLEERERIAAVASGYAVTIDASDNFATRFAANDAALMGGFPLIHGAATGFRGQLMTILPGRSACLRCLFTAPPPANTPTCQGEGVLGPLVGEVGWLMGMEAIKLLGGTGEPLHNRMLTIDALTGKRRTLPVPRNPDCPCATP
ncbi:MAG: HesA/MoeB/ThiF family protein [Magnetococcales bacterium]|nr:HesA/MoeB/ThiF family protein [Magnetococcales bacterium]